MIKEYSEKYNEQVKDLLVELQEHIVSIDIEKYNILTDEFREKYFAKTIEEINKYNGKMLLYTYHDEVIGLIVGIINNEEILEYDFKAPKRGRITELVVSKKYRNNGYGKKLLNAMEEYLTDIGCKDILLGVFGYNENAKLFYERNGYHIRMSDMTKELK